LEGFSSDGDAFFFEELLDALPVESAQGASGEAQGDRAVFFGDEKSLFDQIGLLNALGFALRVADAIADQALDAGQVAFSGHEYTSLEDWQR